MSPDQLYDPAALASRGSAENVGGPRHYKGAEIVARAPWRCPSCGFENVVRELGQGCESCHAGEGAAKHVGVDPIVRPKPKRLAPIESNLHYMPVDATNATHAAFITWMQHAGTEIGPLAAFQAGWLARERVTSPVTPKEQTDAHALVTTDMVGGDLPRASGGEPSAADPALPPTDQARAGEPEDPPDGREGFIGTAQDRTLLAALVFFREQVMAQGPEEVVSGEWMTPGELDSWIAELKGPYA